MPTKTGVLLMTYGSATVAENVQPYLEHVYPNGVPEGLVEDFENRYRLVGRSPLIEIVRQQAELVQCDLGETYAVRSGMLHSQPFIMDGVEELRAAGALRIVGIILAPQFSRYIMGGYAAAFQAAAAAQGYAESDVRLAGPWPIEPGFIEYLAAAATEKLAEITGRRGARPPVLLTTHSLPERVVTSDPGYLEQLEATTQAVIARMGMDDLEWYRAYQSAGHTPEAWLKPDIVDVLAELRQRDPGKDAVLIVPLQFLADHLEIFYDLDIAGREQCTEYGFEYNRTELPNLDCRFIGALAAIARDNAAYLK